MIKYVLLAFFINLFFTYLLILLFNKLHLFQSIKEDGPNSHKNKMNTPTMGGIGILLITIALSLFFIQSSLPIGILILTLISFFIIGLIDDIYNIKNKYGIKARYKLLMQLIMAIGIVAFLLHYINLSTYIHLPIIHQNFDMGYIYIPLLVILIVFFSNAVNLTDGLDGLATSCIIITISCFLFFAYMEEQQPLIIFCAIIIGALLAFLPFNFYKAKIFMGNSTSIAFGAFIVMLSVFTKKELYLFIIGGIFVIEALSVMLQVIYFKLTHGKRIFKMAPLHHHFELKGVEEPKITVCFIICGLILGLTGMVI